jgi:hypothetical protein
LPERRPHPDGVRLFLTIVLYFFDFPGYNDVAMKKYLILPFIAIPAIAGQLSLQLENDVLFHDDSDYTHGTRVEYRTDQSFRFGAQQLMYTPLDLRNEAQIEGRHPYAGYLAGFVGKRWVKDVRPHLATWDDLELQLGVLGPSSGAEQTQKFIHKMIGSKNPAGWDHQLKDEPEIQALYKKGADFLLFGYDRGWGTHLETEAGLLLGTLQIAPTANIGLKFGYGFEPGETYSEIGIRSLARSKCSVYVLAGFEGWYWFRNELLDGNADYVGNRDTLTVEKEPVTGCFRYGLGFRYKQIELKALVMRCTREYKTQESAPNYASFYLGWNF